MCVWGALLREPFRLLVWSDNCSWPLLRLFLQVTQKKGCLKFQEMLLVSFGAVLALGHVKFVWDTQVSSGSPRKAGLRHLHGREGVKRDHHVKSWNLLEEKNRSPGRGWGNAGTRRPGGCGRVAGLCSLSGLALQVCQRTAMAPWRFLTVAPSPPSGDHAKCWGHGVSWEGDGGEAKAVRL